MYEPDNEAREARLPQWAQQELRSLRQTIGALKNQIEGPATEDTVLWAHPYSDAPVPIADARQAQVVFDLPGGDGRRSSNSLRVGLTNRNTLSINSTHGGVKVVPQASNAVEIGIEHW